MTHKTDLATMRAAVAHDPAFRPNGRTFYRAVFLAEEIIDRFIADPKCDAVPLSLTRFQAMCSLKRRTAERAYSLVRQSGWFVTEQHASGPTLWRIADPPTPHVRKLMESVAAAE